MLPNSTISSAKDAAIKPELSDGLDSSQIEPTSSILGGGLSNMPNLPLNVECLIDDGLLLSSSLSKRGGKSRYQQQEMLAQVCP